jgi:Tfp pilus tip-associated adhesin PilY1
MAIVLFILTALSDEQAVAVSPPTGEAALFTNTTTPDALLLLDFSGSMDWNPAGGTDTTGNSSCTDMSSGSTNCSRRQIAKRAVFSILDDNGNGTIDSYDEGSLSVRIGYMRFTDCSSSSSEQTGTYSYTGGCNQIPGSDSSSRRYIGSKYSLIYCNNDTSCTIDSGSSASYCVNGASSSGGTPLAGALHEAKLYLDDHKDADTAQNCRKKFVILITDGSDTYACSGSGAECQEHQYKRRQESVARAKALADAGYQVFIIGFGSAMPSYLQNTLNWMAYYGGTDNPTEANEGSTSDYNPASVTSCATDTGAASATCYDESHPSGFDKANFQAGSNDPGYASLSGYAFLAADADQLGTALQEAINIIRQANYSFSQSSVQSTRTADENFLYEGSFEPQNADPFWKGHLKKFQINTDGTVGSVLWDAGVVLQETTAATRTIYTYKSGALTAFTTALTPADLGFTTGTTTVKNGLRNDAVGYIRGETAFNPEQDTEDGVTKVWKLGDVFRSTPITVGTPSAFYEDGRDVNNQFAAHRSSHIRTSLLGNRLIVAGTNAGQFHAFKTSDGSEAWSFVPPNLLTKLKNMTHKTHPTALTHQYFVDGPVTVADVWWGTGSGTSKATNSWKTLLVFGEGRGATNYAWSSSASCDSGISTNYSTTYKYYCGYYAFNLNDSLNPAYLWHLTFADVTAQAAQAPYLGDPWSRMMVGRIRINIGGTDTEKWVGFIGGGYNASDCKGGGGCDGRGKGFYVVDLSNGQILWSYTHADNPDNMDYSIPGTPAIVDTDNDSFVDTAYIGDLGGNMWRFKFCRASDMPNCAISGQTTNWGGGLFFDASSGQIRPIYTSPAVAKDSLGYIWVYWGTGDKTDPTAANAQEHFYGVRDLDRNATYTISDIQNITADNRTYAYDPDKAGWRIQFTGQGEKMLADPAVFGGVVYFTTYTPAHGNDPCEQAGAANLFVVDYVTGTGGLPDSARSMYLGTGIPSAPVLSLKPGSSGIPDLYVTTSGGSGSAASTQRVDFSPPGAANRTNMLYWKDMRVQ